MLRVLLYWNFVSRVYKTNMVYITNTGVTTNIRKIFASLSHDNSEQVTIFQCYVSGPTQLILPAPKGVKFLKMNNYKDIFKDIMNQYPDMSYSDSPSNLPDEQLQDIVTTPDTLPTPEAVKEMTDLYGSDYDFIVLSISKPGQCAPSVVEAHMGPVLVRSHRKARSQRGNTALEILQFAALFKVVQINNCA